MTALREETVRDYFEGIVLPAQLDAEAAASLEQGASGAATLVHHHIEDMSSEYVLTIPHLTKLIDDVVTGGLGLAALDAVVFCIEASDRFTWSDGAPDADRIPEALFWLGAPEINFALTPRALSKIRHYLETGQETFDQFDLPGR